MRPMTSDMGLSNPPRKSRRLEATRAVIPTPKTTHKHNRVNFTPNSLPERASKQPNTQITQNIMLIGNQGFLTDSTNRTDNNTEFLATLHKEIY